MRELKQILKLRFENKSQRCIASTLGISRNTVSLIFKAADQINLYWDKAQNMDEATIHKLLFPESQTVLEFKQPNLEYIHQELLKPGVTLNGLWEEYVAECKAPICHSIIVPFSLKNIVNM